MRSRVAMLAALVTLIALVAMPMVNIFNMVRLHNEIAEEEIRGIVTITTDLLKGQGIEASTELVKELSVPGNTCYGLYDSESAALYTTDDCIDPMPKDIRLRASLLKGDILSGRTTDNQGNECIYAIYQYEDGVYLLVTAGAWQFGSVIKYQKTSFFLGALIIVAIIVFLMGWHRLSLREHRLHRIIRTLDGFSEGDYDKRIELLKGDDPETAEYNAVLERLQTRIFRQRDRNRALSTIMNQMQTGIIAVDQDMKVILVTPVAKRLLSITGHAEGNDVRTVSKEVDLEEVLNEAMHQTGVYTNDVAARQTVGKGHRPLRLYVSPMLEDGRVVGALALIEDISEMKRLEQVRTDFAANVSHELKTPLTSIRGFVETLENGAIDNPVMAHKFLKIIGMETERLTRLINDILSITKMESGKDEVATERICIDKAAYHVCEMLELRAAEKKIKLNFPNNTKPIYIMGNKDRVEQMLINLIENAIKYNDKKQGGFVTVQVYESGESVNISISDNGIGIAEENLPRLFERFYRVDKGRSRQMGGTGLGLAIVKHIIHGMNGEIEVHSRLNQGTEFMVTLPKAPKEDPKKDTIFEDGK